VEERRVVTAYAAAACEVAGRALAGRAADPDRTCCLACESA